MNKEELQKKCANLIGVSSSEKELAFEVLQERVLAQLNNDGDALRVDDLGVFQFKLNKEENTDELIFAPIQSISGSKTLFLRLPVKKSSGSNRSNDDDIFSISVGKPIVPFTTTYETGGSSDSSFVFIKKKIEERVIEILSGAQLLTNFNLWDDYLKSMKKDEQKESVESESSSLLKDLTEPEPEREEEELDPYTKSHLINETESYSYPIEEEFKKDDDEFLSDYETFKNLTENESEEVKEELSSDPEPEKEVIKEEVEEKIPEELHTEIEEVEINPDEEEAESDRIENEDVFDIEEAVFDNPTFEEDKVDWNWGDELKSEIPKEEPPVVRTTKVIEEDSSSEPTDQKKSDEVLDEDPFGTLEKTMELDPEFRTLTGEQFPDYVPEKDPNYRITNLTKPREVPPKPKTRMTRLTSPVEEPIQGPTLVDEKEKEEVYKSFRERNSNNNLFVIGGIIVILVVIIYFAFSMGDEPSKEMIQPSNQSAQTQADNNIVTDERPITTTVPQDQPRESNNNINTARDNSSKVEEIRISNLIFRRGNEYNVQVSSWRSSVKADAEVKRLKARGYKAFVVQAYLPSKGGTWHRVRIGGFNSEEEARNFLNTTQL